MRVREHILNKQVARLMFPHKLLIHPESFENCEWIPHYCTDWAAGGPIIEREGINLRRSFDEDGWTASVWRNNTTIFEHGETALIAEMRCFVADV